MEVLANSQTLSLEESNPRKNLFHVASSTEKKRKNTSPMKKIGNSFRDLLLRNSSKGQLDSAKEFSLINFDEEGNEMSNRGGDFDLKEAIKEVQLESQESFMKSPNIKSFENLTPKMKSGTPSLNEEEGIKAIKTVMSEDNSELDLHSKNKGINSRRKLRSEINMSIQIEEKSFQELNNSTNSPLRSKHVYVKSRSEDNDGEVKALDTCKSNGKQLFISNSKELSRKFSTINKETQRTGIPTITDKNRNSFLFNTFQRKRDFSEDTEDHKINENDCLSKLRTNKGLFNELNQIEMQKKFKSVIEKFILIFNMKPSQGIEYLNEQGFTTTKEIAEILFNTEGLSQETKGEFFGSPDSFNQILLREYTELIDFHTLDFDVALRKFLSRFRLPGEAQQIDRIVKVFSSVYHEQNPGVFPDEDTPYILSYSIIMLHTDAHSSMVPKKDKMTKPQFVKNNVPICNLSKEYLEKIYDHITQEKFESKTNYIETIYSRLRLIGDQNVQGARVMDLIELSTKLMQGSEFVKYGRKGKPKMRRVWINESEDRILWNGTTQTKAPRYLLFSQIKDLTLGCNTTAVMRNNKIPFEHDSICFSLVTLNRTLDLQAKDSKVRSLWVKYFRFLLGKKKEGRDKVRMSEKKKEEIEQISEIWIQDIFPFWDYHWDYQRHRPKKLPEPKPQKKEWSTKRVITSFIGKCFRKTKRNRLIEEDSILSSSRDTFEEEFRLLCQNKSVLLVLLWRRGMPSWITESLYSILLRTNDSMEKSIYVENFSMLSKEIEETLEHFPFLKEDADFKDSLLNIVHAFILYRPDIGYVKGMINMAAVLLTQLPEFKSFESFVNLTHSFHFLGFLRGEMRDIEWRVKYFDEKFRSELPNVFNHFQALDLSTEIFLLPWLLTLFSVYFPLEMTLRIWDNFLLEKEIYVYKVALGILKYFELELRLSTFDNACNILKKAHNDFDEALFFDTVEKLSISILEFESCISNQRIAHVNAEIHMATFFR